MSDRNGTNGHGNDNRTRFYGGLGTGVPTEAEVIRLMETYPNLQPGDFVSHEDVEKLLGLVHTDARYRTVTNAWRKHVWRKRNKTFAVVRGPGGGFRVETGKERSERDEKEWRAKQRLAARRVADSGSIPPTDLKDMSEEDRKARDHVLRVMVAHAQHTRTVFKELAPPTPPRQAPRLTPGGGERRANGEI